MKKQTLAYWLCLGGVAVSLTLLSIVRFDSAIANTIDTNKDKVMLALQARDKFEKPGGSDGDLKGGILLPKDATILESDESDGSEVKRFLVVRFTNSKDFQVRVWDPRVGKRDGDGIESVTFRISDETTGTNYDHTERKARYCPYGGGEPKCNASKLVSNHKYSIKIEVTPRTQTGANWNFKIQT